MFRYFPGFGTLCDYFFLLTHFFLFSFPFLIARVIFFYYSQDVLFKVCLYLFLNKGRRCPFLMSLNGSYLSTSNVEFLKLFLPRLFYLCSFLGLLLHILIETFWSSTRGFLFRCKYIMCFHLFIIPFSQLWLSIFQYYFYVQFK